MEHFSQLQGSFQMDWLTVYSTVRPRSGKLWHGSADVGRFERLGSGGLLRAQVTYQHGRHVLTLTGEPLRSGADAAELLRNVWPGAALTCQRVDWAWEETGRSGWSVQALALEVNRRLPSTRYGWGMTEVSSPGGRTFYLGALSQPGVKPDGSPKDPMEDARSKPLFVRVYQKVGGRIRVEAECKKLSGVPLTHALEETASLAASFMPGKVSWSTVRL